jgi:hypothetical protein
MSAPAYPHFIQQDDEYIDYEIHHELTSFDDRAADSVANEHSVRIRFTYDIDLKRAYGLVIYEQNGFSVDLGELKLTNEEFYRITGHPIRPEDKLTTLRSVEGSITIKDGVATLPDGTQITL